MKTLYRWTFAWFAAALLLGCGGGGGSTPAADPVAAPSPVPGPAPGPAPGPGPGPTPAPDPRPAVTPAGAVLGPVAASASIGPAGGRLDAPDYGLAVIVPPGALAAETTLTLQPIENAAPGARGKAWRLGPADLVLQQPVVLQWQTTQAERNGARLLRLAHHDDDGQWRSAAPQAQGIAARAATAAASAPVTPQPDDTVARATTLKPGDWSLVAGAQLHPGQTEVEVGHSLGLTVIVCANGDDPVSPGERVHYTCDTTNSAVLNTGWAVNGIPDGHAGVGTLSGPALDPTSRTYTAPAAVPARNPVAVSVQYTDFFDPQGRTETLVAHVSVIDPQAACTWVRDVQSLDIAIEQDWRWSGADDYMQARFAHTARVAGRLVRDPDPFSDLVRFYGVFDQGTLEVAHHYSHVLRDDVIDVTGQGTPGSAEMPYAALAFVDLQTCRLLFAASPWVPATHWRRTPEGSAQMTEFRHAGLDVAITDYVISGQRVWSQERLLPVNGPGDEGQSQVQLHGAHHDFGHELGTARLRWTLTPGTAGPSSP